MAPSAANLQPWFFLVVQSEENMQKLRALMQPVVVAVRPGIEAQFRNHPGVAEESCRFMDRLGGAPVCVLAFQGQTVYPKTETSVVQSIAAAVQTMQLSAWAQGVGSCWLTAPLEVEMQEAIRAAFAPDKGSLVAMVTLGYAAKIPKEPPRKEGRFELI